MLIGEVLGFWFLAGVIFFGVRRLANRHNSDLPHVKPLRSSRNP